MTPLFISKDAITRIALLWILSAGLAVAGSWEHSVNVSASAEHDSNPAMLASSESSVWRARLAPSYTLNSTYGRDAYAATLGLLVEDSSDERLSRKRQDKSGSLHWGRTLDAGNVRIGASADEASTRATEFEDSGNVSRESTRRNYSFSMHTLNEVSARTTLAIGAKHNEAKYEDGTFNDYVTQIADLGLNHAVSEYVSTTSRLLATHFEPRAHGTSSKTYSLSLGLAAKPTEQFSWSAQYGLRHSYAETKSEGSDGSLSMQWLGATNDFSFSISRQFSPSSIGSMSIVDSVKAGWQSRWGPKSRLSADISMTKRHGISEAEMAQATATLFNEISELSSFRLYFQQKRVDQNNSIASSAIIGAALTYNWRP